MRLDLCLELTPCRFVIPNPIDRSARGKEGKEKEERRERKEGRHEKGVPLDNEHIVTY